MEIFPNIEDYDKTGALKKLFTKNHNPPPLLPEPDENGPHTILIPEYKDGPVMNVGFFEGTGEMLMKAVDAVKMAVAKAAEIVAETAQKTG